MATSVMLQKLGEGMVTSLWIFAVTLIFSLPLGLLISFGRMSKNKIISTIFKLYISVMRGTPLMLQLMVIYFGPFYILGVQISQSWKNMAVAIGFVLNYAAYFAEKNTLTVRSMHEILTMISEIDRNSFSIEKASDYYTKYQERYVDDHEAVNKLKEKITGRTILILAPGSSLVKEQDKIKAYIRANNPVIFGVNRISREYDYDYLYLANEKRVSSLPTEKVKEYITTSNLDFSEGIRVNYASYLCDDVDISDDPTLMLINLLMSIGIRSITIAGYDGFSANPDENYFDVRMSLGSNIESKMKKNDLIYKQVLKLKQQIDLDFLTDTLYL